MNQPLQVLGASIKGDVELRGLCEVLFSRRPTEQEFEAFVAWISEEYARRADSAGGSR